MKKQQQAKKTYTVVAMSKKERYKPGKSWDICNLGSEAMAVDVKKFLLKVIANEENTEKYKEIFDSYCISPYGDESIANSFCVIENKLNDSFYTCIYCGKVAFFDLDGARLCEDCYFTEQ